MMNRDYAHFLLLNIGHFLDHLFMLIFATVAALALHREWGLSYSELLYYATPGFVAFGVFALPAGWIADRWSRDGIMVIFFVGIGLASILTGLTSTPFQVALGLFAIGVFGAIYHPVGLAIVTMNWRNTGVRLAVNGVWGNLGVASAALITGYFIDNGGWRAAFIVPGVVSILIGVVYAGLRWQTIWANPVYASNNKSMSSSSNASRRQLWLRLSIIIFVTTAVSSVIFQSTTFALPKIFDERLPAFAADLTRSLGFGETDLATAIGSIAFAVFAIASMAQLVVGSLLDRYGPRRIFIVAALLQLVFFALMPGASDGWAMIFALGFMLGAFGQIPINDFMIGKLATGAHRARIYGVRYVVAFSVLALTLPLISFVHGRYGFDILFIILAIAAAIVLAAVSLLPRQLPAPHDAEANTGGLQPQAAGK